MSKSLLSLLPVSPLTTTKRRPADWTPEPLARAGRDLARCISCKSTSTRGGEGDPFSLSPGLPTAYPFIFSSWSSVDHQPTPIARRRPVLPSPSLAVAARASPRFPAAATQATVLATESNLIYATLIRVSQAARNHGELSCVLLTGPPFHFSDQLAKASTCLSLSGPCHSSTTTNITTTPTAALLWPQLHPDLWTLLSRTALLLGEHKY